MQKIFFLTAEEIYQLRTFVGKIKQNIEGVQSKTDLSEKHQKYLKDAFEQAGKISKIIDSNG